MMTVQSMVFLTFREAGEMPALCLSNREIYEADMRKQVTGFEIWEGVR